MMTPLVNRDPGDESSVPTTYEDALHRYKVLISGKKQPVKPPLGKFEGCGDVLLAELLHAASLDGCDEEFGSVDGGGWFGLIGQFILSVDDRGFFTYEAYPRMEEAKHRFDNLYMVD